MSLELTRVNQEQSTLSPETTVIGNIASSVQSIVRAWTEKDIGEMKNWFYLMSKIMEQIEVRHGHTLKGVEKASLATDTIVSIASNLYHRLSQRLSESELEDARSGRFQTLLLIMDHPDILKASTTFLKQVLATLDTNQDGEISVQECCFCIPL